MKKFLVAVFVFATILGVPRTTSAHEVYILSPQQIQLALHTPSVSPLVIIRENIGQFYFWAFIFILGICLIFFVSISRRLERYLDPFFIKTKHWAPIISRVTVGLSFVAAAYYQALYGPELPLQAMYGTYVPLITAVLLVIGAMLILGLWVRLAALVALAMYAFAVYLHGWYMLTYINYFGEIVLLLIIGLGHDVVRTGNAFFRALAPYSFTILRVFFGIALIYASAYAKIIYSNLALETVNYTNPAQGIIHPLTYYLHFSPSFLVLGAACVEILIGLFFILGIEIRFTAIFLNFWLTLSLIHFGEIVWPHIILIGIPIAFFFYGYDQYSLEGRFFKKAHREPVL